MWHPDRVSDPASDQLVSFDCPRCGGTASAAYYGPCPDCRRLLRASFGKVASPLVAAEYEPKMNVTPNAVALKDD